MLPATRYSRRDLCLMLPALAAAHAASVARADDKAPLPSAIFRFEDLKAHASGALTTRAVLEGFTHDGFRIAMHESDLAPGGMPHPPHHHVHEEMFMVREGKLEVTIKSQTTTIGPGGVTYVASNQVHGVRNVGSTHAQYFVLELGSDKAALPPR